MGKALTKELSVSIPAEQREILMALLGNIGYEGFWEEGDVVKAYIPVDQYSDTALREILTAASLAEVHYSVTDLADQNWNQSWEANFPPVRVGKYVQIVADFHEVLPDVEYTISITPKMSFGTGHHETTRMMIQAMRELSFEQATVLDMGCGTGVLAILAKMKGADEVVAIDIDRWSYENASDNVNENHFSEIQVILGDSAVIPQQKYDIILANINRNVLLADMAVYGSHLAGEGYLLLSGFRPEDEGLIVEAAENEKLSVLRKSHDGEWMAILFQK